MSRTSILWFIICILCQSMAAQVAPESVPLTPNQAVEREIAGGESHTYQINLTAGQFVRFRLAQRALDAALILTSPDGQQQIEINLTGEGEQELFSLEAASGGSYQLTVRGVGETAQRGSYGLEATVQETATLQDRKHLFRASSVDRSAGGTHPASTRNSSAADDREIGTGFVHLARIRRVRRGGFDSH